MTVITPNDVRARSAKVKTKKTLALMVEQTDDDADYGPNGGFTAVLSTPKLDRDGDVWPQDEWILPLPDRITVDADHGMSVSTTIGSARPYFDDSGRLLMAASFSSIPRAQEVRTLIKEGHVTSVSVAALTDTSKKDGTQKRELLNAGVVAIPANPDAIILNAKSEAGAVTIKVTPELDEDAMNAVVAQMKSAMPGMGGDVALTQAIHDASVHLGASCPDCAQCAFNDSDDHEDPTGSQEGANSKSLEDVETKTALVETAPTFTMDQFRAAMEQAMTSSETVEESSVETESPTETTELPAEAAAATDEVPAPAEAADEVVEVADEVEIGNRANHMLMGLYASEFTTT